MACVFKECFAVRWTFFFVLASVNTFEAYSPLYLRQLGFSSADIGFTMLPSLIASPLLMPLVGFLADRYRVRKWILYTSISLSVLVFVAHLLPLASHQNCRSLPVNSRSRHEEGMLTNNTVVTTHVKSLETANMGNQVVRLPNVTARERQPNVDTPSFENNSSQPRRVGDPQSIWKNPFSKQSDKSRSIGQVPKLLFVGMIVLRAMYDILTRMITPMMNNAAITRTRQADTSFGSYRCWGDIGGALSTLLVGMLAAKITYDICGATEPGYFVLYVCVALQTSLSLLPQRWVEFEYLEHKVPDRTEIQEAVFNRHFLVLILIVWFTGFCVAFQKVWEFWYIAQMSGGPVVLGIIGLLRQPFVAFWFLVSGILIKRLGELKTVCLALFLYTVSFLVLSFINNPWLVVVIDVLETAGYSFSNASMVVHFSKSGSVALSAVMLSIFDSMFYGFGMGSGGAVTGFLFKAIGPRVTLRCYSVAAACVICIFGVYAWRYKDVEKYERVENSDSDDKSKDKE